MDGRKLCNCGKRIWNTSLQCSECMDDTLGDLACHIRPDVPIIEPEDDMDFHTAWGEYCHREDLLDRSVRCVVKW